MNFAGLIFLIVAHFVAGRGILQLFRLELKSVQQICLSFIIGVPLLSLAPCFVQLFHIPITFKSIFMANAVVAALCSIPLLVRFRMPKFDKPSLPQLYELPFLLCCLTLVVLSVWRCYYYPVFARDMLAGPELLAEFAVREHTMVSSVFNVDLATTNNYFKSPYITCLQITYKLMVHPFGQLWMSVLFVPFIILLYSFLRGRVHPFLASLLLFLFMTIPDLFAYSFVMLYDYSNMIFFFLGFYYLTQHLENRQTNTFALSVFMFGIATYIRVETLVLITMLSLMPLYMFYRQKLGLKQMALRMALFIGVPVVAYYVCIHVFVEHFVPLHFNASDDVNKNLGDLSYLFDRFSKMNSILVFGPQGLVVYGLFMKFFMGLLVIDIIYFFITRRPMTMQARYALYGVLVIYLGLPLLGYLLPLFDIMNTTKRGLFKIMPLMLMYMANSGMIQAISTWLTNWMNKRDEKKLTPKPAPVATSGKKKR